MLVGIYREDNQDAVWQATMSATQGEGTGASILVDTGILDCRGDPPGVEFNDFAAFAQARDLLSGRVSNSVVVVTGCFVL